MSKHIENIKAVKEAIELKLLSDEEVTAIRDLFTSTLQTMDRIEKEESERLEKIKEEAIQKNLRLKQEAEETERERIREREVETRKNQIARAKSLKVEYEERRGALQQELDSLVANYESDVERLLEPVTENQKALTDLDGQLEAVQWLLAELNELNQSLESIRIEQAKYPSQIDLAERLSECKQDQEDAQREHEVLMNRLAYGKRVQAFITEMQSAHVEKEDSLLAIFPQIDEERERIEGLTVLYRTLFGDGSFALELDVVEKRKADLVTINRDLYTHATIVSQLNERWTRLEQQKQVVLTQLDNLPSESAFPNLKSQAQERLRLSEQEYKEQKKQRIQKYETERALIEQSMAELEIWRIPQVYLLAAQIKPLGSIVFRQNYATHEMVRIPNGEFMMWGSRSIKDSDCPNCGVQVPIDARFCGCCGSSLGKAKPPQKVTLTKDIFISKYLVRQSLWENVMGSNPSFFRVGSGFIVESATCTTCGAERHPTDTYCGCCGSSLGKAKRKSFANQPVESVSWFDAVAFCNKLSELEGLESVYTINGEHVTCNWTAKGYRLPTEAEWEYSARGGEDNKYSGSNSVDEVAWYGDNSGDETHPVGQKKPNGFGLYDMSGNVREWVWDWFGDYSHNPVTDPHGPAVGSCRVLRGGGWSSGHAYVRTSGRDNDDPTRRRSDLGFRIVLSL